MPYTSGMDTERERTELAPGVTLEVTRHTDRLMVMAVEIVDIDKRTVTVKVGDTTKVLHKGDILNVSVPWS